MFYPDLGTDCQVDQGPCVRAIGWLGAEQPFTTGMVPPEFVSALREHVDAAWQPMAAGGFHTCKLCTRARGRGNVWIPTSDVVFVAPELVVHYVEAHGYKPPDAFIQAVLTCPAQGSREYVARMRRFPAWWRESLPA